MYDLIGRLEEELIDKDFRQSYWLALQSWVQPNRIFTVGVLQASHGISFNQLQIYQACFVCNTVRDRKYVMQPELSATLNRLVSVPTDCSKFNRQV